jgi:hypothetical protein
MGASGCPSNHDLPAFLHSLRAGPTRKAGLARDIHVATEALLGGQVSRHTVSDFLITSSGRADGDVERVLHGHYRIRERWGLEGSLD